MITVKVNKDFFGSRKEDGESRTVMLPGGFTAFSKKHNKDTVRMPKDKITGKPTSLLVIEDRMEFDRSNEIDEHNFAFVRTCIKELKEMKLSSLLIIDDPDVKENLALKKAERVATLSMALLANKTDDSFLRTLYRRCIGKDKDLTTQQLYAKISIESINNPDRFYEEDGSLLWESEDYETMNLVYNLLRDGFFREDSVGAILDKDNIKVATSIKGASLALRTDAKLMSKAKSFVNNPKSIEPVGNKGSVDSIYDEWDLDGSLDSEEADSLFEDLEYNTVTGLAEKDSLLELANSKLPELLSSGFIVKDGAGRNTRYHIYTMPEQTFNNKETLTDFLSDNEGLLKDLVSQL